MFSNSPETKEKSVMVVLDTTILYKQAVITPNFPINYLHIKGTIVNTIGLKIEITSR